MEGHVVAPGCAGAGVSSCGGWAEEAWALHACNTRLDVAKAGSSWGQRSARCPELITPLGKVHLGPHLLLVDVRSYGSAGVLDLSTFSCSELYCFFSWTCGKTTVLTLLALPRTESKGILSLLWALAFVQVSAVEGWADKNRRWRSVLHSTLHTDMQFSSSADK